MKRRRTWIANKNLVGIARVFMLLMCCAPCAMGQQIQFGAQSGPYYVGEPVVVQVIITGADAQTKISCQLKDPPSSGLSVEGPEVGRSSRSFTQIINGRMTSSESIDYRFQFVVTASREGEYMVGPFQITADGKKQDVAGRRFRFETLENDPDMRIEVSTPGESVYVGQEVPVTIRWAFAGEGDVLEYAFSRLQIRSPLFDQFTFRDVRPQTPTTLSIVTAKGRVDLDAKVTREQLEGREFVVVTATRTMVSDSAGVYQDIPVTCRTQRIRSWRRDFFGDRIPGETTPALAAGTPIDLVVKPIPLSGRPPSFSGAVGRGFSLDVAANRSVVRVGDPISLTITVRGQGGLSRVSLPPLDTDEGLDTSRFQIPGEQATGKIDGNAKQFNVTVRVKDPEVNQIPAIGFSWFDPYQEKFVTARSKPIALQVMETTVVSASDVVASVPNSSPVAKNGEPPADQETASSATAPSFVGANLAINRDVDRLLANGSAISAPETVMMLCYGSALALVAGSILLRRRANRDQSIVRSKKRLRQIQKRIESAGGLPGKEASRELSRALRDLLADFDLPNRSDIDDLIQRCDNIIYATGEVAETDFSELAATARRLASDAQPRNDSGGWAE